MSETSTPVLLVRAATHICALNLSHVIEVMRPLPVAQLTGAPEMVCGLAVIRGNPVPVVVLARLFGTGTSAPGRFVVVRAGEKQVALAVDEVLGIRRFRASASQSMPPLLRDAAAGMVTAIGALDSDLMFVLNTAGIVPPELLQIQSGQAQ